MNIDRERDALIIVDLQPDFMDSYGAAAEGAAPETGYRGSLPVKGGSEICQPIAEFAREFDCVVATQDWHPTDHISFITQWEKARKQPFDIVDLYGHEQRIWPVHCVQGTYGANLAMGPDLRNRLSLILRKGTNWRVDSYSAFKENWGPDGKTRKDTGLCAYLLERRMRRIFLCGLARDVCVKWSALDGANVFMSGTHFVWDLTRAVDPMSDDATRKELLAGGVKIV